MSMHVGQQGRKKFPCGHTKTTGEQGQPGGGRGQHTGAGAPQRELQSGEWEAGRHRRPSCSKTSKQTAGEPAPQSAAPVGAGKGGQQWDRVASQRHPRPTAGGDHRQLAPTRARAGGNGQTGVQGPPAPQGRTGSGGTTHTQGETDGHASSSDRGAWSRDSKFSSFQLQKPTQQRVVVEHRNGQPTVHSF
jgi:hypothetical protein